MEQYNTSTTDMEIDSEYKLGSKLAEGLNEEHQSSVIDTHNVGDQEHIHVNDDEEEDDDDLTAEILAQSGYGKVSSRKDSNAGDQECICEDEKETKSELTYAKDESSSYSRRSWPSDKKLVSAFKGSREKEGLIDREVRVMWAPDVYDPPVTSDDHFLQDKSEKHKGENKKQKGKQKREGKSAREEKGKGKGKDKKQTRKRGGSSNK
ncbi:hypothetical protein POM88_013338 [Heracleum sosnowskyi]|uniref:Uncharacterized protein n=1 Tax=Heracleum sosnowskyi TaxID=360622 RepID=A0AAD8IY57_9APIA|nr:hypothetical protein POM88_013338 [Heracleum sosnowskyi]